MTLPSGEEGVADSPVSSAAIAAEAIDRLRGAGLDARSEEVVADELEDAGGHLGERVRVGSYATEAEASRARGAVIEAGYPASVWYEGWGGDAAAAEDDGGPVAVNVLTVDPARFRGEVGATFGADLERTETTSELAEGARRLHLTSELADPSGRRLPMTPSTQVISGGPNLVTDGFREVTAARDGMVLPANPGQFYGWVHQRNPRMIAGVDARRRLVLVTVDGRQAESVGMSISEAADLALDLGLVDAVNLDGGGSTTMVVGDELVSTPSGGQERAVGDALVIRGR
ncbi:phosphodiester glycosidase family protein [Brachybacterium squillarum]|uniref:phosphodiester glycosidase family protein n=1 Tax=Brachybacterium squillarum TaxID=661979 RepID=UPI002221D1D9|nr:phosphodiester glycosidase family protein [Brachybacterium squillarum]MCW1805966.1 phosphodiester glycosidase family protein [Brachybacterium squillarum]